MRSDGRVARGLPLVLSIVAGACSGPVAVRGVTDAGADACCDGVGAIDGGPDLRRADDAADGVNDGAATEVGMEAGGTDACSSSTPCFSPSMVFDAVRCECVTPPATSCSQTIDAFCAADGGLDAPCVREWPAAPMASQWCRSVNDVFTFYPGCDGFNVAFHTLVDTAVVFYYDPHTLQLVRVETTNFVNARCDAGTPGLVAQPADCPTKLVLSCRSP